MALRQLQRYFPLHVLPRSSDSIISGVGLSSMALRYSTQSDVHSSGQSSESSEPDHEASYTLPKLVVFGARGFVGSHITQEALNAGLSVIGISRSGTPPAKQEPWVHEVEWARGSALEPKTYEHHLDGAAAVISAVGAFGSQEEMMKTNGTANAIAAEVAARSGVPRFVFISAQIPNFPGIGTLLPGYVNGKAKAEDAVRQFHPNGGVVLRPGAIYGNRIVSSSLTLPLQYVFQPVESLLSRLPSKQLFNLPFISAAVMPPNSVHAVAKAAIDAATNSQVKPGILDPWEIQKYND